ncbi:hypothetical protein LMG19146_01050 [Xanthomonas arboricola pv. fragariae]|nr:hypothetical protein LMG19146_01050 [Xanthomonas arboricola pv. fragariae]
MVVPFQSSAETYWVFWKSGFQVAGGSALFVATYSEMSVRKEDAARITSETFAFFV